MPVTRKMFPFGDVIVAKRVSVWPKAIAIAEHYVTDALVPTMRQAISRDDDIVPRSVPGGILGETCMYLRNANANHKYSYR